MSRVAERFEIGDARRAQGDRAARFEHELGCDAFIDHEFVRGVGISSAKDRPRGPEPCTCRIRRSCRNPLERRSERQARRPVNLCTCRSNDQHRLHRGQRRYGFGSLERMRHAQAAAGKIAGADPNVPPATVEQVLHRHDEAARQHQHVEEQRANGRDTKNAKRRACRLSHETSPRKPESRHRRASLKPPRRNSAHEATTVADAPSGTAIVTQVSATSLVTRTKTSAVS